MSNKPKHGKYDFGGTLPNVQDLIPISLKKLGEIKENMGIERKALSSDQKPSPRTIKAKEFSSLCGAKQTNLKKKQRPLKSMCDVDLKENFTSEDPFLVGLTSKFSHPSTNSDHPWSKEGLVTLYDSGVHVGKGLSNPPHVVPYRFLGTPDLKRDASLLPKKFQFAKHIKFSNGDEDEHNIQNRVEGEPMVLPLTLRAACWNGERWQGTSQTASEAKRSNGFTALYAEVVKSQKRAILCKTGQYFMEGTFSSSDSDKHSKQRARRKSCFSEIPNRQHKHRASIAKPFIPPLPLAKLPTFEQVEALEHNKEILSAYREESSRYASARLTPSANRTIQDNQVLSSGRTISGLPLKACGENSLRQLGHILSTNTSFHTMQHMFNTKLMQSLRAIQTTRPYHFAREFGMKIRRARDLDPNATSHRASTLRKHLMKFEWFEDLLDMSYNNGRYPSKLEIFIIEDIHRVLNGGEEYTIQHFTNLFMELRRKKLDLESPYARMTLLHVQRALSITDLELLTDLMLFKVKLPSWLESKTAVVKQAMRDLSPNQFPMCNWADDKLKRKQAPVRKLRKLYWMKDKYASLRQSRNSILVTNDGSSLPTA